MPSLVGSEMCIRDREWTGSVCDRLSHCEFVQEWITANATKQDGLLRGLTGPPGPIQASLCSEDLPPEQVRPHLVSHLVSHCASHKPTAAAAAATTTTTTTTTIEHSRTVITVIIVTDI